MSKDSRIRWHLGSLLRGRVLLYRGVVIPDAGNARRFSVAVMATDISDRGGREHAVYLDSDELARMLAPAELDRFQEWLLRCGRGIGEAFACDFHLAPSTGCRISLRTTLTFDDKGVRDVSCIEGTIVENSAEVIARAIQEAPHEVRCRSTDSVYDRAFLQATLSGSGARAAALTRTGASVQWSNGETGAGTLIVNRAGESVFQRHHGGYRLEEYHGAVDSVDLDRPLRALLTIMVARRRGTVVSARVVDVETGRGDCQLTLVWDRPLGDQALLLRAARTSVRRMSSNQQSRRLSDVFDSVSDAMSDGICLVTARGEVVGLNRRARELLGASERGSAFGSDFGRFLEPRPAASFSRWVGRAAREPRRLGPFCLLRADGTASPPVEMDMRSAGEFLSVLTIYDMTERLAVQEKQVRERSIVMLGMLSAGMAHDFNNILGIIQNNIEAAIDSLDVGGTSESLRNDLGYALTAVARGSGITGRIQSLSGRRSDGAIIVDVGELVDEWMFVIRHALGPRGRLNFHLVRDLFARVSPSELQCALLNLVMNARNSMVRAGTITVSVSLLDADPSGARGRRGFVRVSVRDQGPGFTRDALARATESDFTTMRDKGGHGLGLSSVSRFVRAAGGSLHLSNLDEGGARVDMYLPRARAVRARRPMPGPRRRVDSALRIVLVDDERSFRVPLVRLLERRGHSVSGFPSAESAIQFIESCCAPDVLVADIALGGMDGVSLAQWMRDREPRTKVLLTTGHVHVESEWRVLRKPFRPAELLHAVAEL